MISKKTNDELKEAFIEAALLHQTAGANAKGHQQAKRADAKMRKVYQELLSRPDGLEVFLDLLHHTDAKVRVWAGPFGLTHFPEQFEPMLEAIAHGESGRPKLDSRDLLQVWRRGFPLV